VTEGQEGGGPAFCTQCAFRPWATQIAYDKVLVTVVRADGTVETVAATFRPVETDAGGTVVKPADWWADTNLAQGDVAFIAQDGVSDVYGESLAEDTPARGI
jgi:hypothetical protein